MSDAVEPTHLSWRMSTSIIQAAALLDWLSARRFPFRATDLASDMEVGWRTANRWLYSAETCGWVRRESIHPAKVIYHPLVTVQTRGNG